MAQTVTAKKKEVNKTVPKKKGFLFNSEYRNMPMFDLPFLFIVLLILIVGLFMLFSSGYAAALSKTGNSYYFISKQIQWAAIGIVVMLAASVLPSLIDRKIYNLAIMGFYVLSIILLIIVLIVSKDSEKRWLYVGSFQFQPSEFAKLAIIMMLALYISVYKDKMNTFVNGIVFPGIIFGTCFILVFLEPHLSGAILIAGIGYVMMFSGGCNKIIAVGGLVAVLAAFFILDYFIVEQGNNLFLSDYQAKRFVIWHDPTQDLYGAGFQPYQSTLTIGSGGLFGLGYGKSRQKYLFLPEPQNDYIFSIISEELGFVGVIIIMLLFVFLIWRGFHIGIRARNTFESMLVIGIISKVAIQTLLNFAVVSNSIPATGISLPFFSYGGTALCVQLVEMGLVLHASRFAYLDKGKGENQE